MSSAYRPASIARIPPAMVAALSKAVKESEIDHIFGKPMFIVGEPFWT